MIADRWAAEANAMAAERAARRAGRTPPPWVQGDLARTLTPFGRHPEGTPVVVLGTQGGGWDVCIAHFDPARVVDPEDVWTVEADELERRDR